MTPNEHDGIKKMIEEAAANCTLHFVTNPTRATISDAFEAGAKWALEYVKKPERLVDVLSDACIADNEIHFVDKDGKLLCKIANATQ
jgi:hypothetical protein